MAGVLCHITGEVDVLHVDVLDDLLEPANLALKTFNF